MILLIRHCQPRIDYSPCNHVEANKRISDYNFTQNIMIEEITPLKSLLNSFMDEKSSIFVSSMPRALITAKALFEDKFKIVGDDRFIEFDLRFIPIPFLKLKFGTWALISRLVWFLGFLRTNRSFAFEKKRAKNAAQLIITKAEKGNIALVAHGMLNMFIEKNLQKQGYKRISKVKNGFFTIITLDK